VSSSGHLALVPRLLGWEYAELPADARKTFEVALHAGSAPALAVALRGSLWDAPHLQALTVLPAAVVGLAFERQIEERLGGVRSVAIAQIAGGLALLAADLLPQRRDSATALDHLLVGCGQAAALIPGVSRSGAALTVALLRGAAGHGRRRAAEGHAGDPGRRPGGAEGSGGGRRPGGARIGAGRAAAGAGDALARRRRLPRGARSGRAAGSPGVAA
jgi:undecaprenyl-diphosphatase